MNSNYCNEFLTSTPKYGTPNCEQAHCIVAPKKMQSCFDNTNTNCK